MARRHSQDRRWLLFGRIVPLVCLAILVVPALVLSLPGPAAAVDRATLQPGTTSTAVELQVAISGRFQDFTTGQVIGGARVTIVKQDGTSAGTAVADAAGDFKLTVETVVGGRLTAVYEAAGYLREESVVRATEPRLTLSPLLTPQGVKEAVLYSLPRSLAGRQSTTAGPAGAAAVSALASAAALTPPATIRVYRTSLRVVQVVDFKFYCKHVLPSEWLTSWPVESLRAGAIAVKEYAWYYVSKGGKWPSLGADVQDGSNDQWYDPNRSDPRTDAAVDHTWSSYLLKNDALFAVTYCGDKSLDANYRCPTHPSRMSQWGTYYLARDKGWNWQQIIHHYWDPVSIIAAPSGDTTRYEQTDARLVYGGTWSTFSTSGASGGSYTRASAKNASVTVGFTGTYLAWIATAGTTLSKAYVSLDGGPAQSIDLARSAVAYQQNVWDTGTLASGPHIVSISYDPTNAAGKFVSLDAVDVAGTLAAVATPAVTSLNLRNGTIAGGTSVVITGTAFTGATAVTFGDTAAASFTVNSATKITAVTPAHAMASVRVQVTTPGGSSADTTADDYAFTTRSEQTATGIVYAPASGAWTTFSTTGASGGSYARSRTDGSYVTISFTGTYLAWIATAGTTVSKADVSVDGGATTTIDLARTATAYQQNVWNTGTLASGPHTVKITYHTGNITGKYVDLDAVEVAGTLK